MKSIIKLAACVAVVLINICFISIHAAALAGTDSDWAKHHNYEEILSSLKAVHQKCPDITHLYNLTGYPDHTPQGRHLAVIVLSDHPEHHEVGKFGTKHS
jgi:hypothetical protein